MGSSSSPSARTRARRSYWVRSTVSPASGGDRSTARKKTSGQRFVEPYRLSDDQRATLLEPLAERDIGDAEGRSLFAAALEYDLASCRRLTDAETKAPPAQPPRVRAEDAALATLAEAAESLAAGLEGLDEATLLRLYDEFKATDRFHRTYGEDYLESLRCELKRLADAGKLDEANAPPAPREPFISADARRFVLRAADAFEDCLELVPDARPNSPFIAAVEAIVAATGIGVPTDPTTLAQILDRD